VKAAVAKGKGAKVKPAAKPAPKPAAKPVGKPNAAAKNLKTPAKAAKPPVKGSAKAPVKAPIKASKPAKPAKPVAKPAAKPAAKPGKVAAGKPVSKVVNKAAAVKKPAAKPVAKPASKPVLKNAASKAPASKTPVSVKSKIVNVVSTKPKPPVAKPVAKSAPKTESKAAPKAAAKPAVVVPPAPAPIAVAPVPVGAYPAVPQKSGRPSSRLAQLTVPSMAQSVASTAAKSSFTPSVTLPLITPPLASAVKRDPKLVNNWKTKSADQLSDAELIAMPDSEYMSDKQMAAFRLKLLTLRQSILDSAGETTEHLREDTVVVPDPADRATIEEEHALELRTRDRERKLLKKIEQSINRIDAGDYGYCDETGEPIGVGRLIARPTATLSLEAQQRRELKQKMFGD
jgi:DnaK suppressor protein